MAQNKSKKPDERRSKDRRPNSKGKLNRVPSGIRKDSDSDRYTGVPANDPSYYTVNPVLAALTSAIPVSPVLGTEPTWGKDWNITGAPGNVVTFPKYGEYIPGAMGIALIPAFGSDMDAGSADSASFNRLCANLFSALVRDKSGTAPFDQAALGHYLACMRSAYIIVHDLKRFISLVTFYSAGNKYFPKGIAGSIGRSNFTLAPSEIDAAMWEVNNLIRFLNTKFVPKMPVFSRDYDLYSRFYLDSQTEYAQVYAFVPRGYYAWDDQNNTSVFTSFGTTTFPVLPDTVTTIGALCSNIIGSLQNSDMFNMINAWLRHVSTPGDSWTLEEMAIPAQPVFMYDEYVLAQIENMRVVRTDPANYTNLDLIQSGAHNYLEYRDLNSGLSLTGNEHNVGIAMNPVFNYHVTVPTDQLKIESSRLCVCAREEILTLGTNNNYFKSQAAGFIFSDQIPVALSLCSVDPVSRVMSSSIAYSVYGMIDGKYNGETTATGWTIPSIAMFKHHPLVWIARAALNTAGTEITNIKVMPLGDIDTIAGLDKDAFYRLSFTCTYSLFSIPGITA